MALLMIPTGTFWRNAVVAHVCRMVYELSLTPRLSHSESRAKLRLNERKARW